MLTDYSSKTDVFYMKRFRIQPVMRVICKSFKKTEHRATLLCVKRDGLGVRLVMECCKVCLTVCMCMLERGTSHPSCFMPQIWKISCLVTNHLSMNKAPPLLPHHVSVSNMAHMSVLCVDGQQGGMKEARSLSLQKLSTSNYCYT